MRLTRALRSVLGAVVVSLAALVVGRAIRDWNTERETAKLRRTADTGRSDLFTMEDLNEVPQPVREYFATVLRDGQQYVNTVRLEQEGELRAGDADSEWKPFTATQYITTEPPGFRWDAAVRFWPQIDLRIVDRYRDGSGHASVTLFGLLPLGGDEANPELDEGELLRYLAEAVWYPTALLPSEGVEWEAIDDDTAAATLEYGGVTATLTFHFTEDGEVAKVHAEQRPRRVGDGYEPTPWTGRWYDYETRDGMRIPTAGEVVWHLPDGEMEAWRGRLTDISYQP
ncbi:DUF6920 family protein [Haloarcula rubripromontorii]|nr:DUF6544 family protein [Haloarcula rubripromontorii]